MPTCRHDRAALIAGLAVPEAAGALFFDSLNKFLCPDSPITTKICVFRRLRQNVIAFDLGMKYNLFC